MMSFPTVATWAILVNLTDYLSLSLSLSLSFSLTAQTTIMNMGTASAGSRMNHTVSSFCDYLVTGLKRLVRPHYARICTLLAPLLPIPLSQQRRYRP